MLNYIQSTDYRYSVQASRNLQEQCVFLHDALRDSSVLHASAVDKLGVSNEYLKKLFTVCQILCFEFPENLKQTNKKNGKIITPRVSAATELDERISKYDIDKAKWTKLKLKPSKFNKIILCKE